MSLLPEIAQHLQDNGLGVRGSTIFEGFKPEKDGAMIVLSERPGRSPVRAMGVTVADQPRLGVLVVDPDRDACVARCLAVQQLLDAFAGTIGGIRYLWIGIVQTFFDVGVDETKRFQRSGSFEVLKEQS